MFYINTTQIFLEQSESYHSGVFPDKWCSQNGSVQSEGKHIFLRTWTGISFPEVILYKELASSKTPLQISVWDSLMASTVPLEKDS